MKHDAIAAVLGVATGTVASRRSRAFERLRGTLGDTQAKTEVPDVS